MNFQLGWNCPVGLSREYFTWEEVSMDNSLWGNFSWRGKSDFPTLFEKRSEIR